MFSTQLSHPSRKDRSTLFQIIIAMLLVRLDTLEPLKMYFKVKLNVNTKTLNVGLKSESKCFITFIFVWHF